MAAVATPVETATAFVQPKIVSNTKQPKIVSNTKLMEAAVTYATQFSTYVASFTLAQVALKASDLGLETADSMLKLANCENCVPVVEACRRSAVGPPSSGRRAPRRMAPRR